MPETPYLPGLFDPAQPPSRKQVAFAQAIATQQHVRLPVEIATDRKRLSAWIERNRANGQWSSYPSSKQVAFAERIARLKRRQIPDECFRDKTLMARWIDGNKPR